MTTEAGFDSWAKLAILAAGISLALVWGVPQAHAITNTHSIDLEKGSSQYLSITDANQTGLDLTGDMTMEAWVKPESAPSTEPYTLVSKWDSANGSNDGKGYIFRWQNNGGTQQLGMCTSSTGANGACAYVNQSLTVDTWSHVAVTYDASAGEVEVFVNGTSEGTANGLNTSVYNNATDFIIGAYRDTNGGGSNIEHWDGLIDEGRMWSDIRTQQEIEDNMFATLTGSEGNLVGAWGMNATTTDLTSNNNDLTINNSAAFGEEPAHGVSCSIPANSFFSGNPFSLYVTCEILGLF